MDYADEEVRRQKYWTDMGGVGKHPWRKTLNQVTPDEWDSLRGMIQNEQGKAKSRVSDTDPSSSNEGAPTDTSNVSGEDRSC